MTHKQKCKKMKAIRKSIADRIGVDLHQSECTYKGECSGTCPRCEQEEKTLNRALLKSTAAVAGLAMSAISLAGCGSVDDLTAENKAAGGKTSQTDIEMHSGEDTSTESTTKEVYKISTENGITTEMEIEGVMLDPSVTVTEKTEEDILTGEEEIVELDGDIAIAGTISDSQIIEACMEYAKADSAEIIERTEDFPSTHCRVACYKGEVSGNAAEKIPFRVISVNCVDGTAVDDEDNTFNILDVLVIGSESDVSSER